MMNDTTKEQDGKNSKKKKKCSVPYLKIMRELEFGKSYIQSCLVILLPKYFISFLSKQKHAHNF